MKMMESELAKKVFVSGLAIFSFLAVSFIFYSQNKQLEEVTFEEIATSPSKDVILGKKNGKTLKEFAGTKYACDNDQFVFIDIYLDNGGYKADVAVADSEGRYAMAYLTEIIGVGKEKKFEDQNNNSMILNEDKVEVLINDVSIVNNCIARRSGEME